MTERICAVDGVPVGESRSGALIHLGALPAEVDADHEIVVTTPDQFLSKEEARLELKAAVEELCVHHSTFHPATGCAWVEKVMELLALV